MEITTKSNLNWAVFESPVLTVRGLIIPDYKAIIREDNNTVLSIQKDSYQPYQNSQLIELLDKVGQYTGLKVVNSGEFKEGRKVWVQIKSDDLRIGNDRVEGYLTGINSFDGSTSLAFGTSNITISCSNSFYMALKNVQNKVRHTVNMNYKVEEIIKAISILQVEEKNIFEYIRKMSETPFTRTQVEETVKTLFGIDQAVNISKPEKGEISTNTLNKLSSFYVDFQGELRDKGENIWGLFSAVTKYTTHTLKDSQESKMLGVQGQREQKIFNNLIESFV
jgi:phage/plasmid-like protein (TIGR03299 family)